jgi:fluoride ion exporter CrcB/FEX
MQIELLQMLDADRVELAIAYAAASVAIGFAAIAISTNLVRRSRLSV